MGSQIKEFIAKRCPVPPLLRRIGFYGFMFFFLKGMLWLTVPGILLLLNN